MLSLPLSLSLSLSLLLLLLLIQKYTKILIDQSRLSSAPFNGSKLQWPSWSVKFNEHACIVNVPMHWGSIVHSSSDLKINHSTNPSGFFFNTLIHIGLNLGLD